MNAPLATLACFAFILYLFWVDYKFSDESSAELWVPFLWMFLAASRYVSQWLNLGGPVTSLDVYQEGSPLDAVIFLVLILAGVVILLRRRLSWAELIFNNPWIWLYFFFGALSVLWSDYSFVSFKRWVKASGNLIMALVILTEPKPYEAVGVILKRLAFLFLPLSVLFIKYYPELGRAFTWSGKSMFTGVASQKNGLGGICLLSSIFFCWSLLLDRGRRLAVAGSFSWPVAMVLIAMTAWLLSMAQSATSLVCIVVAVGIFVVSRIPAVTREPRWIIISAVSCVVAGSALESLFGLSEFVVDALGRDPTLTTRVPMWHGVLRMAVDPIMGAGYESFYMGDRLMALVQTYGALRNSHNGYLETYLNLGLVGLGLLIASCACGLLRVQRYLEVDYPSAILRLCLIAVVVLYNWTEVSLQGVSEMWVLLLVSMIDPPSRLESEPVEEDGNIGNQTA